MVFTSREDWFQVKAIPITSCVKSIKREMKGGRFAFRGCGWREANVCSSESWDSWDQLVTNLFLKLFSEDYLKYVYSTDHGTQIEEVSNLSRCFTLQS